MKGPIPYLGGKSRLANTLITLFPPHITYVEPFCGGAQVFFRKERSRVEVLNDLDGEVVNFLRVCQLHHAELLRFVAFFVHSRRWHRLHQQQDPSLLTDVQRAARFLYLQRTTWGGAMVGATYGSRVIGGSTFGASDLQQLVAAAAKRLERVQLENLPYEQILTRYDRSTTFMYLDPPYVDMPYYRFNFDEADFASLASRLTQVRCKFLLSINDHPLAREAFRAFHSRRVATRYPVKQGPPTHELVFSNFPLPCGSNTSLPKVSTR